MLCHDGEAFLIELKKLVAISVNLLLYTPHYFQSHTITNGCPFLTQIRKLKKEKVTSTDDKTVVRMINRIPIKPKGFVDSKK